MGILNLTPDSFSGSEWGKSRSEIITDFKKLISGGASCVDIGAESTRPGASPVSPQEEWSRLETFVFALKEHDLIQYTSFDTRLPDTMLKVAELGCFAINCVGALPDHITLKRLHTINPHLQFIACHMHGTPETMQNSPLRASKVLDEVSHFFKTSTATLTSAGFSKERIWLDPGIGFGKSDRANSLLLANTRDFAQIGNVLFGVSRKGFIGRAFSISDVKARDPVTKALEVMLAFNGAKMIRTHDVAGLHHAMKSLWAEV
jgi:dihydropteroate synthase